MGVSFPSPLDRVACRHVRSMTTGCRLTHQRLATWQIATFSEIDSRQYAMAYDRMAHAALVRNVAMSLGATDVAISISAVRGIVIMTWCTRSSIAFA